MRHLIKLLRTVHTAALPSPSSSKRAASRATSIFVYTVGAGIAGGSILAAYNGYEKWRLSKLPAIPNNEPESTYVLTQKPAFKPSRTIKYPLDTTGLTLTLYQYQTCPFCCKVRAMLDYFGISYSVVEVNPVLRTQLKWSTNYRKVPILIVETPEGDTLQLNDSSMIISTLYSFLINQKSVSKITETATTAGAEHGELKNPIYHIANFYPTMKYIDNNGVEQKDIMNKYFLMYEEDLQGRTKSDLLEERKWRAWADRVYVHTLSPNIYRTFSEAVDSFHYFDKVGEWEKNFASWERALVIYVGAAAMWMVGKRLQRRHNLNSDVRKSLYQESDHWMAKIKKKKNGPFMGGQKPNLADLAVYGVLSSIEGCEAFRDLDDHSSIVKDWYRKVQQHIGQPAMT